MNANTKQTTATREKIIADALGAWARRGSPEAQVCELSRLIGGASHQMWAFDVVHSNTVEPLILRLAAVWGGDSDKVEMADEARLLTIMDENDVPVPRVRYVLTESDGLGEVYIMQRLEGETLPRRILRDGIYAGARDRLAYQCGRVLAGIHKVPVSAVPFLRHTNTTAAIDSLYQQYLEYGEPRPVFELAFRWLRDHRPSSCLKPALVHGDFRNGNLIINRQGLLGVLDWELAHIGNPMADLGWLCVNSWRFGNRDLPVGGFGSREQLFAGYEEFSGQAVNSTDVAFWEIFGCLKWGVICQKMAASFISGADHTVERGAIGRRASEVEIDLLSTLMPYDSTAAE